MINVAKLHAELVAAAIPVQGVSSEGRIDFLPEATEAQRQQAAVIVAAHDPTDTTAIARQSAINALKAINFGARRTVIDGITASAGVKTALKAMNRTEWLLARALFDVIEGDPGE